MPARLNTIIRALEERGITVDPPRGGGSHWKAHRADGGPCFMLTAHNGVRTQMSDGYIRGLCRAFDFDLDEFKRSL